MPLTPEQEKRFDTAFPELGLVPKEIPLEATVDYGAKVKTLIESELRLEQDRLILAFKESANIMFREHDMEPCDCLMRYVERKLKS